MIYDENETIGFIDSIIKIDTNSTLINIHQIENPVNQKK